MNIRPWLPSILLVSGLTLLAGEVDAPASAAYRAFNRAFRGGEVLAIPKVLDLMEKAKVNINDPSGLPMFRGLSPLMFALSVAGKNGGDFTEALVRQAMARAEGGQPLFHINPFETNEQNQTLLFLAARARNGIVVNLLLRDLTPLDRALLIHAADVHGDLPYSQFPIAVLEPAQPLPESSPMVLDPPPSLKRKAEALAKDAPNWNELIKAVEEAWDELPQKRPRPNPEQEP